MLNELTIKEKLEREYDYRVSVHGKERILGVFTVGNANYGFADTIGELQFITVYLPSFYELCLGDVDHNGTSTEYGRLMDIRTIYSIYKSDFLTLELLFSNYKKINPMYKAIFNEYFCGERENIAKINPYIRIHRIWKRVDEAINKGNEFEAMRLYLAVKLYMDGKPCCDCFRITDPIYVKYLKDIKNGNVSILNEQEKILNEIEDMADNVEDNTDYSLLKYIQEGIIELVTASLREAVSIDSFEESLTESELKIWKTIYKDLKNLGEITISLTKAIAEVGVSRPVWKALFNKMEKNGIAFIENKGVKGTRIILKENVE